MEYKLENRDKTQDIYLENGDGHLRKFLLFGMI